MKRIAAVGLIGILLLGVSLWRRARVVSSPDANAQVIAGATSTVAGVPTGFAAANSVAGAGAKKTVSLGVAAAVASRPSTPAEKVSLTKMTKLLSDFSHPKSRLEDLVSWLKKTNQNPTLTRESNPYTGEMTIVRTQNPLPGTRYFHAQFLSAPGITPYVQHMSFEFKPGPQAFQEAKQAVEKALDRGGRLSEKRGDFLRYELQDGYILWIKKMGPEDLEENPFNAYTPQDVGTIRVALELSPHEAEE